MSPSIVCKTPPLYSDTAPDRKFPFSRPVVRDESEWDRIAAYIEDNPVKAGLARCAKDYRWSSAGKWDKSAAATSGCATSGLTP
jgi:hypothetical protein